MAARIGTALTGREARSLVSVDIASGMLFETQRPCLNQPKLCRVTLASKNDRRRVDYGQTESQLKLSAIALIATPTKHAVSPLPPCNFRATLIFTHACPTYCPGGEYTGYDVVEMHPR